MKRNEGIIYLALGFGRTIVEGEKVSGSISKIS